ncbi:dihydrofolate reductase-like domain-containing protein [Crucibulum laeve]|uniref:Dihydrofolate reductase n=1 Tax=Crucibulum laeve TaxID=68775 RepID=A0A5C3M767_9AGAR|nr:dihydrofolate reductase-like domain-containing protein [Crucibulum laeve]
MSPLTIIVAATKTNGIGLNARLPWRLPKEMKYFAQVTANAPEGQQNAVIMGRNTWESIPKKFRPLPNRQNIVISRNESYDLGIYNNTSTLLKNDLSSAVAAMSDSKAIHRAFVIGGASLYTDTLALPLSGTASVDRALITRIIAPDFEECDVFMPNFLQEKEESVWTRTSHQALQEWVGFEVPEGIQEENGVNYEFQMWVRQK